MLDNSRELLDSITNFVDITENTAYEYVDNPLMHLTGTVREPEFPEKCVSARQLLTDKILYTFTLAGGTLLWSVVALIAGAVFGLGAYLANQEGSKLKYFGMNLLLAVFTAEGMDNVFALCSGRRVVNAKSIIGVLCMDLSQPLLLRYDSAR